MPARNKAPKPLTVGFVGDGASSARNTKMQLDNGLPDEVAMLLVDRLHCQMTVIEYLEASFGDVTPSDDMIGDLSTARDAGSDVLLILIPSDPLTQVEEITISQALELGIVVKDLTHSLDEVSLEDMSLPEVPLAVPEPAAETRTAPARRTRKAPEAKPAESISEPPRRGRGRPRKEDAADEAQATIVAPGIELKAASAANAEPTIPENVRALINEIVQQRLFEAGEAFAKALKG